MSDIPKHEIWYRFLVLITKKALEEAVDPGLAASLISKAP